ncbi:MAG: hypothetical protein NZM31_06525 [Gemmatales bacterium]|nr:hypothetical protein [Gemmatales bacterium]MDW8386654.1 hypothetical protein [Gemmatales bacterium]
MGSGAAAIVCLALLAAGQGSAGDVTYMNEREFQIPITLPEDPAFLAEIEQLFLYVSTDEGKTWRQEAVASPRDKYFPFYARQDGSYWFGVSVQDKMKRTFPPDITAVPPALKVVVDTRRPVVKFLSTERVGEQVSVSWDVRDENLDLSTCQLEYTTQGSPTWQTVSLPSASVTGKKTWSVGTTGPVTVRMTVHDHAGNVGSATAEIPADTSAVASLSSGPPAPQPPSLGSRPAGSPVDNPFPMTSWQTQPLPPGPPPPPSREVASNAPAETLPRSSRATPSAPAEEAVMPRVIASTKAPSAPAAWTAAPSITPASVPPPVSPRPGNKTGMPMLQYTNQLQVDLNYEAKAGPSGVGEVQLWITQDDGRTWRRFADDPDLEPPLTVELPGEGTYGFTLIIRSKGGIYKHNKQAPLPGDMPELRVEVDTTAPEAELYAVEADPRRKDTLFLQWKATDKNLGARPVTLKWAERLGGEWHDIASDLPNTGRYEWLMPSNLPYRIYLRLEVRDLAGNVSVAETDQPVLVDLVEPDGGLIGIMPSTNRKP